jgi:hypothetical protein
MIFSQAFFKGAFISDFIPPILIGTPKNAEVNHCKKREGALKCFEILGSSFLSAEIEF